MSRSKCRTEWTLRMIPNDTTTTTIFVYGLETDNNAYDDNDNDNDIADDIDDDDDDEDDNSDYSDNDDARNMRIKYDYNFTCAGASVAI